MTLQHPLYGLISDTPLQVQNGIGKMIRVCCCGLGPSGTRGGGLRCIKLMRKFSHDLPLAAYRPNRSKLSQPWLTAPASCLRHLRHVDLRFLTRIAISGGNIKNCILAAAFIAGESGRPIRMQHLVRAVVRAREDRPAGVAERV
jgi:hypothetical protein